MTDRCPLTQQFREGAPGSIPDFCLENCSNIWDRLVERGGGIDDVYEQEVELSPCVHEDAIEFSHDSLTRINESAMRHYVIVYVCSEENCGAEVMETSWAFNCPHE